MSVTEFTDFVVTGSKPEALDETLRALPGVQAFVVGGPSGPFHYEEDGFLVRVFGNPAFFKFAVGSQGYCQIVRAARPSTSEQRRQVVTFTKERKKGEEQ